MAKLRKTLTGIIAFGMLFSVTACNSSEAEENSRHSSNSDTNGNLFEIIGNILNGEDLSSDSSSPASSITESSSAPGLWDESSGSDSSYAESETSSVDSDSTNSNDSGDTLTILSWVSNSDTRKMVDFFLEEKGYDSSKVQIEYCGETGEGARDSYKNYLRGDDDADLLICDCDWVQQYINDDTLTMPLSEIGLYKIDFPNAFDYTFGVGTNSNGDFMAATWQTCPGGFVYRADLAKEYLGVNTPDEMQKLVKDWDTFQKTGAKLYKASGGKTSLQSTEGGLWQVFQSCRTQPWVADGKLVIDNAEDFYDIAKSMKDNKSLAGVSQWWDEWYASIYEGTALGDFVPSWGLTTTGGGSILENFTNSGDTALGKNMAICEGPSGWFWGGSYIALASKCDNASLAKEFIEFYCEDSETMKKYAEETGDFMNNKAVMSEINISNPLLNGQNHYEVLLNVLDKLDLDGKITEYDSVIKGLFNDSVNGYLNGLYASKTEAIQAFKSSVKEKYPFLEVN